MKLETIIKKKNKKKQLENPFRKSSISQLCTKYWSRLTFLINISLHSIKAPGRLTLIETTSILLHTDFYEYRLVASGIGDNFFPPNKASFLE